MVKNIGCSRYTGEKNKDLLSFMNVIVNIVNKIHRSQKYNLPFQYIDLTSGCGFDPTTGKPSSPLLVTNLFKEKKLYFNAHFIEKEKANLIQLEKRLEVPSKLIHTYHANSEEQAPKIIEKLSSSNRSHGLIYCDPNPGKVDHGLFQMMACLISKNPEKMKKIDVMLYVAAEKEKQSPSFLQILESIQKKHWIIRQPIGRHQWSLCFGSNYQIGDWKKKGFFSAKSSEGMAIFERMNLTAKEQKELPPLPGSPVQLCLF